MNPRLVAAYRASRHRRRREEVDFAGYMFGAQRGFYESPERTKIALTSRRAGKSTAVAGRLLGRLYGRPGRHSLYLTLTRKLAKRILWPAALSILRDLNVPHTTNLTDLEIRLNGGGTLLVGGVDTNDQIERYRGDKYQDAAVDEMQSFPGDRAQSLIDDVLQPALFDYQGDLLLTGTPGPIPAGYWFDLSGPNSRHKVHRWTGNENPHIPHFAEELERLRIRNGWTETTPTYLREYCGVWVVDADALVYPFDELRNSVDELPLQTASIALVDPSQWRFVISVDVGQIHATSFVVVAAHPSLSEDYIVHAEKMLDMQTDKMAGRITDLMTLFPGPVVMDTQGVGKRFADEIRERYAIPVEAAEKADKFGGIRIIRSRLMSGQLLAVKGAANPLISEWQTTVWNKQRNDHEREQEDHCADAAIYAVKRLRNYTTDHLRPAPEPGTREYVEAEERQIWERRKRQRRHARKASHLR